jgi:hypothetical protein
LNQLYYPLDGKARKLVKALVKLPGFPKVTTGFFNGHYHKNDSGQYQEDKYPIPVVSIKDLCDIEIDFDEISVTTKLKKDQVVSFDWGTIGAVQFEVYGVEDYLNDMGNDQDIAIIKENVLVSKEEEFFVSFFFHLSADAVEVSEFLDFLRKNHFYY